jgi:hypothetical protein
MESPNTKHYFLLCFTVTVSCFTTSYLFSAKPSCSFTSFFLYVSTSILNWATLSFSSRSRSLSNFTSLHVLLSATWNLTLPQPMWYHRLQEPHWVPDFIFLSQPLHNPCTMLSTGPGFVSIPLINNNTATTDVYRIIYSKVIFPPLVTYPTADRHKNISAQIPSRAR